MAIGSGLTDRARTLRYLETEGRANGLKVKSRTPDYGPWFRCLYVQGTESEQRTEGGVRKSDSGQSLMTGRRALDGTTVDILSSDEIEIASRRYGEVRMQVNGRPERIVKKRTWIGMIVQLTHVNRKSAG